MSRTISDEMARVAESFLVSLGDIAGSLDDSELFRLKRFVRKITEDSTALVDEMFFNRIEAALDAEKQVFVAVNGGDCTILVKSVSSMPNGSCIWHPLVYGVAEGGAVVGAWKLTEVTAMEVRG